MNTQIITSLLDTDLYKTTMQQAVLELFPKANVEYRFKNRGVQKFTPSFLAELRRQIQLMSTISLSNEEYSWIQDNIPFFKPLYLEYLRNYRYNPDEVYLHLDDDGNLDISIKGSWHSTILWEVPLMALISELYFTMIDTDWVEDHNDIEYKAERKSGIMAAGRLNFADFGTRRRRSHLVQDSVIRGLMKQPYFRGTSNIYFAMRYDLKPIGTMAHEWIMGVSALEGLRHANYHALQDWVRVYNADLGIALTDTFGTPAFFDNFNVRLAKLYDGVRHDSGDPVEFAKKVIAHYEKLGIDPKAKTIVFSDGLDINTAIMIDSHVHGKIKTSYGIGTHLTNDFENSPALNMVIKLWSINGIPVVKLSDILGKVMGDPDAVKVAQWTFQNKPLPDVEDLENALKGFLEIKQWCEDMNVKDYGRYQTALNERMAIAEKLVR
jgi:nicotinate phosphoribosyltransferase